MQLAILHYHLNHGGVARVVENHLKALAENDNSSYPTRVLLIQGRRETNWPHSKICGDLPFPVELVTIESLDYDEPTSAADTKLGLAIEDALKSDGFLPKNTLLHWHNHSLGKNVSAPIAVDYLASRGYRTLLQIHDFAEDFRPDNYRKLQKALETDTKQLSDVLYPQSAHIHYATLNQRDRGILGRLGVEDARLHLVPNPVAPFGEMPNRDESRRKINESIKIPEAALLLSYPVRGIRRKNVGEMLLWSALLDNTWFFLTLAPENPVEKTSFDRWNSLSTELQLPCRLGKPDNVDLAFPEILAGSDCLITTSVAEGFGMAFLEAWLADRKLMGRNLSEITADASEAGIDLIGLYGELAVPCLWIKRQMFIHQVCEILRKTYESFGLPSPSQESIEQKLSDLLDRETIDFARLPYELQKDVIHKVTNSTTARNELLSLNPKLQVGEFGDEHLIETNAAVVSEKYSLATLGQRLYAVYEQVMGSEASTLITGPSQGSAVLDTFLSIDRLHPIRVQP